MKVYYFGPYDKPGHFFFGEDGRPVYSDEKETIPWKEWEIDGVLQPGCFFDKWQDRWRHEGPEVEGVAALHHKAGWTALSFFDRTVDKRGACNSTFIAEGILTFDQMIEVGKKHFGARWAMMKFQVVPEKGGPS